MTDTRQDDLGIEQIIQAAEAHGIESEPDHEVGDLQDILRAAWDLMSSEQRNDLLEREDVQSVLEWLPEEASTPRA